MDFKEEILKQVADGKDWKAIAQDFADSLNAVHDDYLKKDDEEKKLADVKTALINYFGESGFSKLIASSDEKEFKEFVDNLGEGYRILTEITNLCKR